MIFIKKELSKTYYDYWKYRKSKSKKHLNIFGFDYVTNHGLFKIKKESDYDRYKGSSLAQIGDKYYLVIIIEPDTVNTYIDTEEKEDSEALQKFYEWADRVMEGLENEQNNNSL